MNEPESLDEFAARMGVFMKNRAVFPEEELMKYAGQWIAWSPDGTAIVAHSAESDTAVYDTLKANGYDIGKCCVSYVPDGDELLIGGSSLMIGEDEPEVPAGE